MKQHWRPWLLGLLLLQGCSLEEAPPAPGGGGPGGPSFINADAGVGCARPLEGCACEPDQPSLDCYPDPVVGPGGALVCQRGTRYCRSGAWTACESVTSYELRSGPGIEALITGPSSCNPCDPSCAVSRDIPSTGDLPGRSRDLDYDPIEGGIVLRTVGTPPPPAPDSDGDGIPDFADECVGPGAFTAADGSCYGGTFFYRELPYGGPTQIGSLPISVQVRTADVYFLMDTTGSMGGSIANLQRDLTTGTFIAGCGGGIIGAIRCTIPDAWFGVGYFDDYPVSPYGASGDDVYRNLLDIGVSVTAAQTAVNSLLLHYGADGPESQTQALWAIATGWGLGPYLPARSGCPAGRWGYPCFRDGTIPIVVMFTDAPFHNGPFGYDYEFGDTGITLPTPTPVTSSSAYTLPATTSVSGNATYATARDVGDIATTWTGWSGGTNGLANTYTVGCGASTARDAVFRFRMSSRRQIYITTETSGFDTVLSLRRLDGTEIVCNDNAIGTAAALTSTLDPGEYYLIVTGAGSAQGSYRLSLGHPPRSGDTFETAWVTGDAATSWTGWSGTTCSHLRNDYTGGCAYNDSRDGVFRFTVSTRSTIRMTTSGSSFDTLLTLRNSAGAEIGCNDDTTDLTSTITATLDPGTYYLVVTGYGTACGDFRLSLGVPPGPAIPTGYPVTWTETVNELNRTGIRVITVHSGGTYGLEDANALADATGSYSSSGARYVFPIAWDGTGLSAAAVASIVDLANYNRMDITARAADNLTTPLDERGFVESITAVSWGPGSCSGISGGSTFVQCLPGTNVDFRVAFRNDFVAPLEVPQVFDFWIEVVGDGTFVLDRIPVRIVVPPSVPIYPPSGAYWRDYDSQDHCVSTEAPDWNDLTWDAPSIPPGTSIRWEVRTAATEALLDSVTPLTFTTPPNTSPVDIGARLTSAGQTNGLRHLRVTAVLLSNAERTQTPVLRSFELRYACIPTE